MNIRFIGILVSLLVVGIFAVQNSARTSIHFLLYELNVSKAIVIIAAVVIGCIIGLMVSVLKTIQKNKEVKSATKDYNNTLMKLRELEEDNRRLEAANAKLREELEETKREAAEATSKAAATIVETKAVADSRASNASTAKEEIPAEADEEGAPKSKWSNFFGR